MLSPALRRLVAVLAVFVVASCAHHAPEAPPCAHRAAWQPETVPDTQADGRLAPLASPVRYALTFDVDPRLPRFAGTARIEIDVPTSTSFVVLHGHSLNITSASALVPGGPIPAHASTRTARGGKAPEELVLAFDRPLLPGRATLAIAWDAPFDDELGGLYRVKDGEAWYAFTQFEATDARRAFPCFDEPGFKVPFEITITAPNGLLAVANTPETKRDVGPAKTTFRFAQTPPLPSYLVALAVGDFDVRDLGRAHTPPIRLITTKGKSGLGALGLEATAGLVDALATWFAIPYPYEKLDIVAVPDFAAGAMENPGLVTFREELLLLDPARASVRARRSQALVIAHELAHQWFGDLVTAAWWDDLWLNEGFATWMETRVVSTWRPAYGADLDAVTSGYGVMDLDALASARAVRQPVVSTSDAQEAFDGLTYEKGAAVLSMIERWVGEEAFRRGVRDYLQSNAWRSVHADKLFTALDRASGKNVSAMAATFLDRPGVPAVSAQLSCDRGGRWHVELAQEPWRPLGSKAPQGDGVPWIIPVCVLAQGQKPVPACADLAEGAPSLVAGRGCPAYVHPNALSSYYRFTLSEAEYGKLTAARAELDVPERISLLSNAWASVRAGKLESRAMLKFLPAFDGERARQVVDQTIGILATMSDVLVEDEARPAFRKFVLERLAARKKRLGWLPGKDEAMGAGDETILRRSVLWAMGELAEDDTTLREAEEHASRWLTDPASVDSDAAAIALDLASRRAGEPRLAELQKAAKDAKTREDRILALKATMGFEDPAVLVHGLDATLGDEIRPHDMRYVLGAAFGRRKARPVAEAWVRAHWDELRKKLPGSLGAGLVRAAGAACTKAEVDERTAFYTPRVAEIEGAARPLAEHLESASLCSELRAHGSPGLTRALLNRVDKK